MERGKREVLKLLQLFAITSFFSNKNTEGKNRHIQNYPDVYLYKIDIKLLDSKNAISHFDSGRAGTFVCFVP